MPSQDLQKTLGLIKDIFDSYNNSVISIETKKEDYIQVIHFYFVFYDRKDAELISND